MGKLRIRLGIAAAVLLACGEDTTESTAPPIPAGLEVVAGDGQVQFAGRPLLRPLIVQLVDAAGDPAAVSGVEVRWSVTEGEGSIMPAVSTTELRGRAQAEWTLGAGLGLNRAQAAAADFPVVEFTARGAEPGPIVFVSNRQSGLSGNEFEGFPGDLYAMNEDGSDIIQIFSPRPSLDYVADPAWDPDGKTVVFGRWDPRPAGGVPGLVPLGIHRISATGFAEEQLPESGFPPNVDSLVQPSVTMGKVVAHWLTDRQLYTMRRDGSVIRRLTESLLTAHSPDWSPDGTGIAFACSTGSTLQPDICTVDAAGENVQFLTGSESVDGEPAWSPDGTQILFSRDSLDGGGIWLMNNDGTGLRQVVTGRATSPAWAPDGMRFATAIEVEGQLDIYVVEVATGAMTNLTNSRFLDRQPTWRW